MEEKLFNNIGVQHDSWQSLRSYTAARIALGRTGTAIPLRETLRMKLARAHARDAVYSLLDIDLLKKGLEDFLIPVFDIGSQARSRSEYLQRPDLGRCVSANDKATITQLATKGCDISIVLADGLSATAINRHAIEVLKLLIPMLKKVHFTIAPVCIAAEARVAIADEIGSSLQTRLSLILIGERPGLTSPDSMGAYITYNPRVGLTDESRNCISNIRPEGLSYIMAANKIFYLVQESLKHLLSGVSLKENHNGNNNEHLLLSNS